MTNFILTDRKTDYLLPPSLEDWLSEDHLARFVVEVVDQLDISTPTRQYAGRGSKAYHPATLLAILVYDYATGVFSSRKLERATYDSVAFRYISAGSHPDHDTLATFRRRFLGELEALFVQVLALAQEMKLLKLGTVCLDGTKMHANASRHSALSHGHIEKLEVQLKAEVQELLALAEKADQADVPDGVSLPEEIKRREDRLAVMADAKRKIATRAQERYEREKAEYDEKMTQRAVKEKDSGKKSNRKPPKPPEAGPKDSDQINLTDEESRIMPTAGGGFEQAYNAQAGVDAATMLVIATQVTQATNDKEQVEPMLAILAAQSQSLGEVTCLIADTGFCSEKNIRACEKAGLEPLIAVARDAHHPHWRERHSEPASLPDNASPTDKMRHRLKTKAGRALYALRKQTVEPVFGIIKSVMGFRQFSLRGLQKVRGEWQLVCLAWNVKRMAKLRPECG
ncbi:transposase [Actimicrobium sp. GrIS 1.19]|uniref:IS1182 family transposase n=1 Tax=Actimicrobium sp. GrIS 1.19 TaxID=3071708 RepID=UPI002E0A157C|nr:transposase [Actimicrobium sp. GrIS 1.19]